MTASYRRSEDLMFGCCPCTVGSNLCDEHVGSLQVGISLEMAEHPSRSISQRTTGPSERRYLVKAVRNTVY